jgi:hypothetical protein
MAGSLKLHFCNFRQAIIFGIGHTKEISQSPAVMCHRAKRKPKKPTETK